MQKHYKGFTDRMLSELETISNQMSHPGEKGRNNELVLREFLERNLAKRYTVSTGKVVSVGGHESGQVDLIVHDRLNTPALVEGHAWRLVPIESVYAVIAVKTSLDKGELSDGLKSVESVRALPRRAAMVRLPTGVVQIPEAQVLRPRGFVFAFKSAWASAAAADAAFRELLLEVDDNHRPNAVCILDQCFIVRRAYTVETLVFSEHALMHFFVFLSQTLESFPKYELDLARYFTDDYGTSRSDG